LSIMANYIIMRNRNVSNGNANKPPRAKKNQAPASRDSDGMNVRNNIGPDNSVFHAEQQGANETVSRAEQSKFGDWHPRDNSAIIQQRDVDGDSTGGRKGKK
jgi:hypothetical protein